MARGPTVVPFPGGPAWLQLLRLGRGGAPIADFRNAMIALRNDPAAQLAFAFDEMQYDVKIIAPPPLAAGAEPGAPPPRFADPEDVSRLLEWLQLYMPKIGRENVEHALDLIARERSIHPLRLWLRTLETGVRQPILDNWLSYALGCPDDFYHRLVGRMFAIAMVARIFEPGCQCDYMPVLEGPQGEEKSKFCQMLAGPDYFSDHIPELKGDQVRVSAHMRGKWLMEVSDLAAFHGAAVETLKAFITRRVEIYIPKYGRKERREPRQCLLIGTTNQDEWNQDATGGRRFWPLGVVRVDLDWLAERREQLFAEAVYAYDAGEPWWPARQVEKRLIAPVQAARQFHDAWEDIIADHLQVSTETTMKLVAQTIGVPYERLDPKAQERIVKILKKQQWNKHKNPKGRMVWRKDE